MVWILDTPEFLSHASLTNFSAKIASNFSFILSFANSTVTMQSSSCSEFTRPTTAILSLFESIPYCFMANFLTRH